MLRSNSEGLLNVNKGKSRAFVSFCVDLAKAKEGYWQQLFEAAHDRGDFKTKFTDGETAYGYYEKLIPALVDNIITLAACVSNEEHFTIESMTHTGLNIQNGFISMGFGSNKPIRYSRVLEGKYVLEKTELIKECGKNELVDIFFDTMDNVLQQPKEGSLKKIPILQCPECKQPFLARRWDQKFCNLQHSQKWRSREQYKKQKRQGE